MPKIQLPKHSEEEAIAYTIAYLRNRDGDVSRSEGFTYFDLYVPNVISYRFRQLKEDWKQQHPDQGMVSFEMDLETNSEPFYEAAWSLCTRGVLYPGSVKPSHQMQFVPVINAGFYFTRYGREWLQQLSGYETIPAEYGHFARLLSSYDLLFGEAYHMRSQEAIKCYRSHVFLACCVMCGAASESILLSLAIAKTGDEERVMRDYRTNTGKTKIERLLLSNANSYVQQELPNFTNLLKYWRDDAAHGMAIQISEAEAFTSILLLLRFAQFSSDNWTTLTGQTL